ncbi:reversion-inducing cysteine-rich protein with Kazal motifs-like isoform X2 [Ornithodoros turicata]|uniref:reversion-inducing cysteine-rich protein with Kazal motifs-like isoform X2 n=1 Tax=Ornithodoros turicata TaxID=34597 RepID=UPI003138D2BF
MWSIAYVSAILWSVCNALGPSCCKHATGSCKLACDGVSLLAIATDHEERFRFVNLIADQCPDDLVEFWSCINDTLNDINRGDGWYGRPCCHKPKLRKCQLACIRAQSNDDLQPACRQSDEIEFHACLEKQELGEKCCNHAQTPQCYVACKNVFIGVGKGRAGGRQVRAAVDSSCSQHSPAVLQCVRNITHARRSENAHQKIHCCEHAPTDKCRTTCLDVLRKVEIEQDMMDALLEGGCGEPTLHDRLWQCFLYSAKQKAPETRKTLLPVDGAKIQCCLRATTVDCQRLCLKTFGSEWGSYWESFHTKCQYHPAEVDMQNCLVEVDEPCELGCRGLSYCTHFNNRPAELFHSCTKRADRAAENDIRLWSRGLIRLPTMDIPVHNVSVCRPEEWKAVACALQIKPCHRHDHVSAICKQDCVDILNRCVDRSRLGDNQTPYTLCESLAPPGDDTPCISIKPYMKSDLGGSRFEVTHPCKQHTCNATSVCILDRKCTDGYPCSKYRCVPGCPVGERSKTVVPVGTFVRIPTLSHDSKCYAVCRCSSSGSLEDCTSQQCTGSDEPCWIAGRKYAHNTRFPIDCSDCFCDSGKVTCTGGPCSLEYSANGVLPAGLPCKCPKEYYAVCGSNGKTYPNVCLARCAGLTAAHYSIGACFYTDPCADDPCPHNQRCVPVRKICLVHNDDSCKQYRCVNTDVDCLQEPRETVCDTEQEEHYNLCAMLKEGKSLAYTGSCESHCRQLGEVCGIDGETYTSACAAKAQRVLVDYHGPCMTVSVQEASDGKPRKGSCSDVRCPALPSKACVHTTLMGVCCPICGTALQVGYNEKLATYAIAAAKTESPMMLREILNRLRERIYTSECDLFGYLDLKSNIIVLVVPVTKYPTRLQVSACQKEAQKLDSLIRARSPRLLSVLSLSVFTTAVELNDVNAQGSGRTLSSGGSYTGAFVIPIVMALLNTL